MSRHMYTARIVIQVLGKAGSRFQSAVIRARGGISVWSIGKIIYNNTLSATFFLAEIPKCPVWHRKPAFKTKISELQYCDLLVGNLRENFNILINYFVSNNLQTFNADIGALYGPFILHILPASVHRTVANMFNGSINSNPLCPMQ